MIQQIQQQQQQEKNTIDDDSSHQVLQASSSSVPATVSITAIFIVAPPGHIISAQRRILTSHTSVLDGLASKIQHDTEAAAAATTTTTTGTSTDKLSGTTDTGTAIATAVAEVAAAVAATAAAATAAVTVATLPRESTSSGLSTPKTIRVRATKEGIEAARRPTSPLPPLSLSSSSLDDVGIKILGRLDWGMFVISPSHRWRTKMAEEKG
jgi:hypothetical protein